MEQRTLGRTGLRVSEVGLGTLTWGRDTDAHEAGEQLADLLDAGGTLIDTGAAYSGGDAERVLGKLLAGQFSRDDVVLVTKGGTRDGARDASRGNLLDQLDRSLRRMGTDRVDLWLVTGPDPHTAIDETLSAMDIAVRSGRARYAGLSNYPAWELARAATMLSDGVGLAAAEMEYSLLARGVEREVIPALRALGCGLIAWSPLGRGVLTGKYRHSIPADSRAASPHLSGFVQPYLTTWAAGVVEAVVTAADGLGHSPLDVALAWVRGAPGVSCAVLGARTAAQLRGGLAGLDLRLPDPIRQALDDISAPELGYPER